MLKIQVTLPGAVMMGMGSIVGTGVFVSLGLAAGLTGPSMILSLFLAGILATCNGLSTAQLAASHPLSGGTYEYAYRYLNPWLGYFAGWLFVCAKCASAATAAIGFGGYFVYLFGITSLEAWQLGLIATGLVTLLCLFGINRTSLFNTIIVSLTLVSLLVFVFFIFNNIQIENFHPFFNAQDNKQGLLHGFLGATALMFVAYTGYGRIATLGEEIKDPVKNIPKAIVITLAISFLLYMAVAIVAMGTVGSSSFYQFTVASMAPLEEIAKQVNHITIAKFLSLGAITAMLGVLLNLILGVSRVIYAMGKKEDLPFHFSKVNKKSAIPYVSVVTSGLIIFFLVFLKDIKMTWSFSAFTVLFYYAITNASALRLPKEKRLYPRIYAWMGLLGCLTLSLWVDFRALALGLLLLIIGACWRWLWKLFITRLS